MKWTHRRTDAVWLTALVALLSLHVWFPRIDLGILNDSYSVEVGGRNALYQLAEYRFFSVERNLNALTYAVPGIDTRNTLCLLGPARYPTPAEWDALLAWVSNGGSLLIAARWDDPEFTVEQLSLKVIADEEVAARKSNPTRTSKKKATSEEKNVSTEKDKSKESRESKPAKSTDITTTLLRDAVFHWRSHGHIAAPEGATILIARGDEPQAVRIEHGLGRILVVASDYVFSNESLAVTQTQNGNLAFRLLEAAGGQGVVFDESLNATGTPKVVGVLLDQLLRPISVQLAAVLLVFVWHGNRRFGGVLPESMPERHDITEHTSALGNLYYKVGDGRVVLRAYLDQLKNELRLKLQPGQDARVLSPIVARTGQTVEQLSELFHIAETAASSPRLSRREAARLIRRLSLLRRQDEG